MTSGKLDIILIISIPNTVFFLSLTAKQLLKTSITFPG